MYALYSFLLAVAFVILSPMFYFRREKYASGFKQRLGDLPQFIHDSRPVIWLHAVSVGEVNAARPLVDGIRERFPDHRVVVSTTTKTGQDLARRVFADSADAVFYFPFDFKFSVRKALAHFDPSVILLMETEIWPRFITEANGAGARVAIVNGRLSERSYRRYAKVRNLLRGVLKLLDVALMQGSSDANRLISLGARAAGVEVIGNLKFDIAPDPTETELTRQIAGRFALTNSRPTIVAASTHDPEERWILDAYCSLAAGRSAERPRLIIAPRHPERFDKVAALLRQFRDDPACEWSRYTVARRSSESAEQDRDADIILLDSIGELRAVYPLATIVFVGGSLVPHGGQSVLEPAAAGKAIITGPHTHNFAEVNKTFLASSALIQIDPARSEVVADELFVTISDLLEDPEKLSSLGTAASDVMTANRGSTAKTIERLTSILSQK
ncbi:MAG: 3-deoxy-D-manno-octulosonic acid transferase [Blastocatellia bacterium]|nr:3-deoxy-D-manno-octulosonic acid transferase [Blastocatellia bacterium]